MIRYQVRTTKLQEHADRHGISTKTLARLIGVEEPKMRKILKGVKAPDVYEAILLADILLIKDLRDLWEVRILEGFDVGG